MELDFWYYVGLNLHVCKLQDRFSGWEASHVVLMALIAVSQIVILCLRIAIWITTEQDFKDKRCFLSLVRFYNMAISGDVWCDLIALYFISDCIFEHNILMLKVHYIELNYLNTRTWTLPFYTCVRIFCKTCILKAVVLHQQTLSVLPSRFLLPTVSCIKWRFVNSGLV